MWLDLGWVVAGCLGLVVSSMVLRVSGPAALALVQDATVHLLFLAWVVLIGAALARAWNLVLIAGLLACYQLVVVVPRMMANHVPRWVTHAPKLRVLVVNVFVDNKTPGALARSVLEANADIIVIVEWNRTFLHEFDAAGGAESYPHRVVDPDDRSDYAVGIVSRTPLSSRSRVLQAGPLNIAQAVLDVGHRCFTVLGVNPMAAVDPGGYEQWKLQVDALIAHLPTVEEPFVVAGDLNTTTFRSKVRDLLDQGLTDAHESLGYGMSASFKLAADGVLSAPGAVVRLDHVLLGEDVRAVSVDDLPSNGSDHLPFVATLAVKQH